MGNNYPNPFNPETSFDFSIFKHEEVEISVYDITGRLVQDLVNGSVSEGYHSVVWDGRDNSGQQVSAGLYLYTLKSNGMTSHAKMVLMK